MKPFRPGPVYQMGQQSPKTYTNCRKEQVPGSEDDFGALLTGEEGRSDRDGLPPRESWIYAIPHVSLPYPYRVADADRRAPLTWTS